ncbi:hypothetical protein BD770DRAFT_381632 [Pilaira anomala]|nr:hypothetical protein BD770DRAFT_381632 [Pilaira anomala]
MPGNPMTKEASSKIQSSQAKNSRDTGKGSFSARVQSTADTRDAKASQGNTGQQGK